MPISIFVHPYWKITLEIISSLSWIEILLGVGLIIIMIDLVSTIYNLFRDRDAPCTEREMMEAVAEVLNEKDTSLFI